MGLALDREEMVRAVAENGVIRDGRTPGFKARGRRDASKGISDAGGWTLNVGGEQWTLAVSSGR